VKKMDNKSKIELVNTIIEDVEKDLTDEEIMHLILDRKMSVRREEEADLGARAADALAKFAGSWKFVISFTVVLLLWIAANVLLAARAFDPYPFILLNLLLSCLAAIQAPVIMMSQNRQERKDRERAENDYKVNLKSEIILEDLHDTLTKIMKAQGELYAEMNRFPSQND
jgi:uncharacterized membrane protein